LWSQSQGEWEEQVSSLKSNAWLAAIVVGLIFVVAGAFMLVQGAQARNDVRNGLQAEAITTSSDATLFGVDAGLPVDNATTAKAQADVIHYHSLTGDKQVIDGQIVGGTPYSGMSRDDPARATYLDGVALRGALMLAYTGFKVSDLVQGIGAAFVLMGIATGGLLGPALYWAVRPVTEKETARVPEGRQVPAAVKS
jgi:hypothetical protein